MGKGSAEIAADNERRRNALRARVARLDRRLHQDYDDVTEEVTGRVRRVTSGVSDRTSRAREKAAAVAGSDVGSDTAVARHPKALVAGAAVAGFAAAAVLSRDGESEPSREKDHKHDQPPGFMRKAATKGVAGAMGALQGEIVAVAKDFVKGAWEGHREADRAPQPMGRARRDMLEGLERDSWRPSGVELPG